jgi:hypothetical protein
MGGICEVAVEVGSVVIMYKPNFIKIGSDIEQLISGIQRVRRLHKPSLGKSAKWKTDNVNLFVADCTIASCSIILFHFRIEHLDVFQINVILNQNKKNINFKYKFIVLLASSQVCTWEYSKDSRLFIFQQMSRILNIYHLTTVRMQTSAQSKSIKQ